MPVVVNLLHRCCHRSVSPAVTSFDVIAHLLSRIHCATDGLLEQTAFSIDSQSERLIVAYAYNGGYPFPTPNHHKQTAHNIPVVIPSIY